MKNIISKIGLSILLGASLASCSKFDEINVDPLKVNESQVQIEYLFNNALIGAQQDPHIAERVFVLYWKTASRQQLANGLSTGSANDGWSVDYWGRGYASQWLNNINKAIQIGESRIADNSAKEHINNVVQISRSQSVFCGIFGKIICIVIRINLPFFVVVFERREVFYPISGIQIQARAFFGDNSSFLRLVNVSANYIIKFIFDGNLRSYLFKIRYELNRFFDAVFDFFGKRIFLFSYFLQKPIGQIV